MSNITPDSSNKKRLGRGLGSLLGGPAADLNTPNQQPAKPTPAAAQKTASLAPTSAAPPTPPEARVWQVAVEKLVPSQFQPRSVFNKEKLEELAASIKEKGILQPIVARKLTNGAFEIIAGERRWRAAQVAGLHEVPVLLKTLSNKETLEIAIIENVQREDLSPIEEAEAYQRLLTEFNLTQQQVAEKVGKDRATVANALRLLGLPIDVRELVASGRLTTGHAKVLLGLESPKEMTSLAKRAAEQQVSVRSLEKEVQALRNKKTDTAASPASNAAAGALASLEQDLQKHLGTRVQIEYTAGKGKMAIYFYSNEELTAIAEKVKAGCKK